MTQRRRLREGKVVQYDTEEETQRRKGSIRYDTEEWVGRYCTMWMKELHISE